jgi:hypothetical protein
MELDQAKCRLWNNFTAKSSGWGKEMKDMAKTLEDATIVDGQKVYKADQCTLRRANLEIGDLRGADGRRNLAKGRRKDPSQRTNVTFIVTQRMELHYGH